MVHNSSQIRTLYGGNDDHVVGTPVMGLGGYLLPPVRVLPHPHTWQVFTESGAEVLTTDCVLADTVLTPRRGFVTVLGDLGIRSPGAPGRMCEHNETTW